jgi:hypothetical protein
MSPTEAKYLSTPHNETGSWFTAAKCYDSTNPKYQLPYHGRIFQI